MAQSNQPDSRPRAAMVTVGALAVGVVAILLGNIIYGFDFFFAVVGVLLAAFAILALARGRPWPYLGAAIASLLLAFVMFQLNLDGPSGEDPTRLALAFYNWFGWLLMVIGLVGFGSGILAFRQVRQR